MSPAAIETAAGNNHMENNTQLSEDELELRAQGHVGELPRQFSAVSLLSLAFSITNSWIGYSAVFITPLFAGGGPGVIYCLLVASIACSFITAGLAELASAFPSSGGQYQLVSHLHPAFLGTDSRFLVLRTWSRPSDSVPLLPSPPVG